MRNPIPLSRRKVDGLFLFFFLLNLTFITYVVDLEQLVIVDPAHFQYPLWPPRLMVDRVHWWAQNFDPLQWARPPWWRATIWIDVLLFGPFYVAALYAFGRGRDWIRKPAFLWSAVMMTNVSIIMFEELVGPYATPRPGIVTLANAPWFCIPIFLLVRLWRSEHPFTEERGPRE